MAESARKLIDTKTKAEQAAGFSAAVRVGDTVFVSGTNAAGNDGSVERSGDAAGQTRIVLERVREALELAGSSLGDVVRTRVFLRNAADAPAVARIHREVFATIRPANSFLVARPIGDDRLVEIEADVVVAR